MQVECICLVNGTCFFSWLFPTSSPDSPAISVAPSGGFCGAGTDLLQQVALPMEAVGLLMAALYAYQKFLPTRYRFGEGYNTFAQATRELIIFGILRWIIATVALVYLARFSTEAMDAIEVDGVQFGVGSYMMSYALAFIVSVAAGVGALVTLFLLARSVLSFLYSALNITNQKYLLYIAIATTCTGLCFELLQVGCICMEPDGCYGVTILAAQ